MPAWICRTCANQHDDTPEPPADCAICDDPRQYVGWEGQQWTTLETLRAAGHHTEVRDLEPGLRGIGVSPQLGIGQRALLVTTPEGNALWDPPGFIDEHAVDAVQRLGGLKAISASHPHFYGVMVEWAHAFDADIVLPAVDKEWIQRKHRSIRFYEDEAVIVPGVTLIRCGGHFVGSAVLHWAGGAQGRGVLLTGDTLTVVQDRDWISIMWSYPNLVPLDADTVRSVANRVASLRFDRIYGGWWGRIVQTDAKKRVASSVSRYLGMISSE